MKPRIEHIFALLASLALTVLPVWQDPSQTLIAQLATTGATALLLFVSTTVLATYRNAILGGLALVSAVVAAVVGHFSVQSGALAVLGFVGALVTQLRTILSGKLPLPTPGAVKALVLALVTGGALLVPARARAQTPVPSDVAPPLSFCVGATTTCVVPDMGLSTVSYDLVNKKWAGGITQIAVGYALLFASEQQYASGFAIHAAFNFDQAAPSYFAPTFALVGFHWFEAGYTPVFYDGKIGQQLTLGVNLNAEALTTLVTGKNLSQRLAAKKAALGQ
ncbi:MAG: hypothetical protein WB347_21950 [Terriglobales bacterium]